MSALPARPVPLTRTGRAERFPERWRVVLALFTVVTCVACSVSAFGVFLPVLAQTFGWSRGAVSAALSINLILGGFIAFPVASIADRHGPRGVLVLTIAVGSAGFALTSRVATLAQFYFVYGVMVAVGTSWIYVLATSTVSRWFVDRRGLALAVVLSGFNVGWLVGGPLAAMVIRTAGWQAAYVALGGLMACVGGPASLWVRYPERTPTRSAAPEAAAERARAVRSSLDSALADPRLWLFGAAWFCMGLVFMMVTVHSVPFAVDLGLPLERASLVLTAYGVGASLGRLASGITADRLGAALTIRASVLAQGAALAVLLFGPPAWALTAVIVVFGIGAAAADTAFVKSVPEVFGLGALATVMAVLSIGWRLGGGIGPAGAGFLYDATGSYRIAFGGALVMLGVVVLLFTLASRTRPRVARF